MNDISKKYNDPYTDRINYIAELVTRMLEESVSSGERIWAASHLFGVADHAALLAGMRDKTSSLPIYQVSCMIFISLLREM